METVKRLWRSRDNRMIAGICGGLGEYFNIDPVIVRLIWLLLVLGYGVGIVAYIIAWIIVPPKPLEPVEAAAEETASSEETSNE